MYSPGFGAAAALPVNWSVQRDFTPTSFGTRVPAGSVQAQFRGFRARRMSNAPCVDPAMQPRAPGSGTDARIQFDDGDSPPQEPAEDRAAPARTPKQRKTASFAAVTVTPEAKDEDKQSDRAYIVSGLFSRWDFDRSGEIDPAELIQVRMCTPADGDVLERLTTAGGGG